MRRLHLLLVLSLSTAACARRAPALAVDCVDPDAQLARLMATYRALPPTGCGAECDAVRRDIERLGLSCPAHVPTMEANATFAFEDGQTVAAQQLLDLVLARPGSHAEAAVLRARIAVEEGNLPFAARLVAEQLTLAPAHPGLHELAGAVAYFERRYEPAEASLRLAAKLGAPAWRVAYHLGLIREAQDRVEDAMRFYAEALAGNPGWAVAEARLAALKAAGRP